MGRPTPERRRDPRFAARLPITLKIGRTEFSVFAENICARGLFIATPESAQPRQLVKMRIAPAGGESLELMAMMVWSLPKENAFGRAPGLGFQFYAVDRDLSKAIGRLLAKVAKEGPAAGEQRPLRKHPRHAVPLRVQPKSLSALFELYTRDVSAGGMFVETTQVMEVGDQVLFEVIHPHLKQGFRLPCKVKHVSQDPSNPGVGLEFVGLDDATRRDFHAFVTESVEELAADELDLIDEDDPKLS